jgi:hypothetical protein
VRPYAWQRAVRDSDLDGTALKVLLVLSTYMNQQGRAFPSKDTLAAKARVSKRTVDEAINRGERAGLLVVRRSPGRAPNLYVATRPGEDDPTLQPPAGLVAGGAPTQQPATLQLGAANPARGRRSTLQPAAPELLKATDKSEGPPVVRPEKEGLTTSGRAFARRTPFDTHTEPRIKEGCSRHRFSYTPWCRDCNPDLPDPFDLTRLGTPGGATSNGTGPPHVEVADDGGLLWSNEAREGEQGVLDDLQALVDAGLAEWVDS